jgi:hypothetical protein
MGRDTSRWLIAAVATFGIVALLAWARNEPPVGGRFSDPQDVRVVVVVDRTGEG